MTVINRIDIISNYRIKQQKHIQKPKKEKKRKEITNLIYPWIELQLPDFRRRRLESGDRIVGLDIEHADEAVNRSGGGNLARRMGGDGDDSEAMSSVFLPNGFKLFRVPKSHSLVQRAGE